MKVVPPASVPPRLAFYVFALGLSLIVLGGMGCYMVYRIDAGYTALLSKQIPAYSAMRHLARGTEAGYRVVTNLPASAGPDGVSKAVVEMRKLRQQNSEALVSLQQFSTSEHEFTALAGLLGERSLYRGEADGFLNSLVQGMDESTYRMRRESLAQRHASYLLWQDQVAEQVEALTLAHNNVLSKRSVDTIRVFGLIALWPVVVGMGMVLFGLLRTVSLFAQARRRLRAEPRPTGTV